MAEKKKVRLVIKQVHILGVVVEATDEEIEAIKDGTYEICWEAVDKWSDMTELDVYTEDNVKPAEKGGNDYDITWFLDNITPL